MLRIFWVAAVLLPTMSGQAESSAVQPDPLARFRDRKRPLLVFEPLTQPGKQAPGTLFRKQLGLLSKHNAELTERDVEIEVVSPVDREDQSPNKYPWKTLRASFHVGPQDFTVILVGKDGGEKFRSHDPVTIEKLTALIDAMPMRQQEMKDGHTK